MTYDVCYYFQELSVYTFHLSIILVKDQSSIDGIKSLCKHYLSGCYTFISM